MTIFADAYDFRDWAETLVVALCVGLVLVVARIVLNKAGGASYSKQFRNHITMLGLTIVGIFMILISLPFDKDSKTHLLGAAGIILTAAVALSSTTVLGNALAGVQLRVVGAFRAGDFLRVGEHFGRVTEHGLFHTEIQNEDRDLTTLPNLFLVTTPYKVVRGSGSFVSCTVSLGYDYFHGEVSDHLLAAAKTTGLEDPFVQVDELGDFSVAYRVAGLLNDVKHILNARSNLRKNVLDALHLAGIEIMSPAVLSMRQLDPQRSILPGRAVAKQQEPEAPEDLIFDKAEEAELLESAMAEFGVVMQEIAAAEKELRETGPGQPSVEIQARIQQLADRRDGLKVEIGELTAAKQRRHQAKGRLAGL